MSGWIILNDWLDIHAPKPVDCREFNWLSAWASIAAANAGIPIWARYDGLTVLIDVAGVNTEYVYHWGTSDASLIVKSWIQIEVYRDSTQNFSDFYAANSLDSITYPLNIVCDSWNHTIDNRGSLYTNMQYITFVWQELNTVVIISDWVTFNYVPNLYNIELVVETTSATITSASTITASFRGNSIIYIVPWCIFVNMTNGSLRINMYESCAINWGTFFEVTSVLHTVNCNIHMFTQFNWLTPTSFTGNSHAVLNIYEWPWITYNTADFVNMTNTPNLYPFPWGSANAFVQGWNDFGAVNWTIGLTSFHDLNIITDNHAVLNFQPLNGAHFYGYDSTYGSYVTTEINENGSVNFNSLVYDGGVFSVQRMAEFNQYGGVTLYDYKTGGLGHNTLYYISSSGDSTLNRIIHNNFSGNYESHQAFEIYGAGNFNFITTNQTPSGLQDLYAFYLQPSGELQLSTTMSDWFTGQNRFIIRGNQDLAHIEINNSVLNIYQIDTPVNFPWGGSDFLYFKNDDNLYKMDSTGLETMIGGGGSGANTYLSNLTSPTAINQDLIFTDGADRQLIIANQSTMDTSGNNLLIRSGNANGLGNGGNLSLAAGSSGSTADGGWIFFNGGPASTGFTTHGGSVALTGGLGDFGGDIILGGWQGPSAPGQVKIAYSAIGAYATLDPYGMTSSHNFKFPNASGTFALTTDITTEINTVVNNINTVWQARYNAEEKNQPALVTTADWQKACDQAILQIPVDDSPVDVIINGQFNVLGREIPYEKSSQWNESNNVGVSKLNSNRWDEQPSWREYMTEHYVANIQTYDPNVNAVFIKHFDTDHTFETLWHDDYVAYGAPLDWLQAYVVKDMKMTDTDIYTIICDTQSGSPTINHNWFVRYNIASALVTYAKFIVDTQAFVNFGMYSEDERYFTYNQPGTTIWKVTISTDTLIWWLALWDIPFWQPNTAYNIWDIVKSVSSYNSYVFHCTFAGTSDSTEPTWNVYEWQNTIDNNSIVWQTGNTWYVDGTMDLLFFDNIDWRVMIIPKRNGGIITYLPDWTWDRYEHGTVKITTRVGTSGLLWFNIDANQQRAYAFWDWTWDADIYFLIDSNRYLLSGELSSPYKLNVTTGLPHMAKQNIGMLDLFVTDTYWTERWLWLGTAGTDLGIYRKKSSDAWFSLYAKRPYAHMNPSYWAAGLLLDYLGRVRIDQWEYYLVPDLATKPSMYFSTDGSIVRDPNNVMIWDKLYWNGSIAGYELTTDDKISFRYLVDQTIPGEGWSASGS